MAKRSSRILKHPLLKNVEYGYITKNKKKILEFEGSEIEGMKWIDFQRFLGSKLSINGRVYFTIKFKNDPQLFTGVTTPAGVTTIMNDENKDVLTAIEKLNKSISSKSDGISTDLLLSVTKQSYETHINFLNNQISRLEKEVQELESEAEGLADDCVKYESELNQIKSKSDYLPLVEKGLLILQQKFGGPKVTTLENSDTSDIPQEILEILGTVDYLRLQQDQQTYRKIVDGLRQYIVMLPQK